MNAAANQNNNHSNLDDISLKLGEMSANIRSMADALKTQARAAELQRQAFEEHRTRTEIYMREGCQLANSNKEELHELKGRLWKVALIVGTAAIGGKFGIDIALESLLK